MRLTGHGPAVHVSSSIPWWESRHHRELPSASHTAQDQALSSGRQDMDLSQSAPHHHTDPSISRAHWGLPAPHGIMGFPVLARAGTDPAGFHAEEQAGTL